MTADRKHSIPANQEPDFSRFGLFGDFPTRIMVWVLRSFPRMPHCIEACLLYFFSFVVLILARKQREAIRSNLNVIWDDLGWIEGYVGVLRVFINFGWTYIDGLRTRLEQDIITWHIDGGDIFEKLRNHSGAGLIFTTHTGNYDLAAALFASKFGRTLHTVRAPERSPYLQEMRKKELAADTERYEFFKVHYNESQNLLGVELAKLLMKGELVAIQGDRIIADVVALEVPLKHSDSAFKIPKGPMTLAALTKCPCLPLYVVRTSYRTYRVIFEPALELPQEGRVREKQIADAWVKRLIPFLRTYGLQWFVFEEAFSKAKTS